MRVRRLATAGVVLLAVIALTGGGQIAWAGQRTTTPFTASEWIYDNCAVGAACEASATADGLGNQMVSSSISRTETNTTSEWSQAVANGSVKRRLPSQTSAVSITYRWRVDSATTSANSTTLEGAAVGRVFARGSVWGCNGCSIEDSTDRHGEYVASTYSRFGPTPPEVITLPGSEVTHTITLRAAPGRNFSRELITLNGATLAFSYVGEKCSKGVCQPSSGHAGTASAAADLQLLSITVQAI
ncbi:MAG TPA: hypothetical protein VND22_02125 [Actinomycetota bacterium]|nr:hypothetical protein [Actinomycetota bacterium]